MLSKEDEECLQTIQKCWPMLTERTKGYMLGVAETAEKIYPFIKDSEEQAN